MYKIDLKCFIEGVIFHAKNQVAYNEQVPEMLPMICVFLSGYNKVVSLSCHTVMDIMKSLWLEWIDGCTKCGVLLSYT